MLETLLDTDDVAARIKRPRRTLEQWRCAGRGPVFIRCGRGVRYRERDVEAWLAQNTVTPGREESQAGQ